ncbi:MAG: hypothetical protein ACJ75J_03330 [Cytophagaceae bacterium]
MKKDLFTLIAELEKQFMLAKSKGLEETVDIIKALANQKGQGEILLEFALGTMEKFSETDNFLVAHYCRQIIEKHSNSEQLKRVYKIRKNLPPLPGLRDYRIDYDGLLEILEARKNGQCICLAKTRYNTHPSDPLFEIISTEADSEAYVTRYRVRCRQCHTNYLVTEDSSYHFPLFQWEKK